jgi:acetyl esterase/lipase
MVDHLQRGIRWVKEHAAEFGVDPARLGLTGASAGGHLASLAAVAGAAEHSTDTSVHAVGVFFPLTDLIAFAGGRLDLRDGSRISAALRGIGFNDRLDGVTDEQIADTLTRLSPARRVSGSEPPFLLIHGDADTLVPLQQSELMLEALKSNGVSAKLIVKEGGAHPWPTIHEEVAVLADWFDKQLALK